MVFDDWRTQRPCAGLSPASIPWRVQISRSRVSRRNSIVYILHYVHVAVRHSLDVCCITLCISTSLSGLRDSKFLKIYSPRAESVMADAFNVTFQPICWKVTA
jgi:hypothetical protein